ncbi:hypothetical protein VHUM_00279 [Vanrija humicola]|uniref:Glycoprotein n=1 Tax=Vanrija humicola TaxID=5417 RepID=A0A7D8V5R8_VANHU|nr:hypothetical protein VHUM_00279 [Vanrija humicola]
MFALVPPTLLLAASLVNGQAATGASSASAPAGGAASSAPAAGGTATTAAAGGGGGGVYTWGPEISTAPTGAPSYYNYGTPNSRAPGVLAQFPNGPTNPEKPEFYPIGAQVNQTSLSRLLSLNGVDDFCMYGPMEPGPDSLIGNVEPSVVAYCTQPRNGARLIPDGTIHSAHVIKTPLYVQIHGFWDGTRVNIPAGDTGGELDPHGEKNEGNPIGGNVTTNLATGEDTFYEEWMSFVSFDQFCLRICTAGTDKVNSGLQCEHKLDIMGCRFVMAIPDLYSTNGTFTFCEGEPAAPPGLNNPPQYTVGDLVTPGAPAYWPRTSNCQTFSSISNGINPANFLVQSAPTVHVSGSGSAAAVTGLGTTTPATVTTPSSTIAVPTGAASSGASGSGSAGASGANTASRAGESASASGQPSGAGAVAPISALVVLVAAAAALF